MKCYPFFSILLALGNPTIDIFSLDVEGSELPILRAIPFEKVCNLRHTHAIFLIKKWQHVHYDVYEAFCPS